MYWIGIELVPIISQYVPILPNITGAHLDWSFLGPVEVFVPGCYISWWRTLLGATSLVQTIWEEKFLRFLSFFEMFCRDFDYGSDNVLCQCDGLIRTLLRFLWPHSHNMMHRWCYKAFCLLENSKQMLDPTFFHWENFRG